MKKIKWFLSMLFLVLCISLNAQTPKISPITFNVNFGDSEINGLIGAEVNYSRYSFDIGWRPAKIPVKINSWTAALTAYGNPTTDDIGRTYSYYLTAGFASEGWIQPIPIYLNDFYPYSNSVIKKCPAIVVLIGCKSVCFPELSKNLAVKAGAGFKTSEYGTMLSFEVLLNFALIK